MADATATNTAAATPAADAAAPAAPVAAAPAAAAPAKAAKAAATTPAADPAPAPAMSAWYPISGPLPAGAYLDNVTGRRVALAGGEVRQVRFAASVDVSALSLPKAGPADAVALMNEYGRRKCEIRYQAVAPAAAPDAATTAAA